MSNVNIEVTKEQAEFMFKHFEQHYKKEGFVKAFSEEHSEPDIYFNLMKSINSGLIKARAKNG